VLLWLITANVHGCCCCCCACILHVRIATAAAPAGSPCCRTVFLTWPFLLQLLYDAAYLLHTLVCGPQVNCLPKGVHGVVPSLQRKHTAAHSPGRQ
jgi:hypothetical protein